MDNKEVKEIRGFFGPYKWLQNTWPCRIEFGGRYFPSIEYAIQASMVHRSDYNKALSLINEPLTKYIKMIKNLRQKSSWIDERISFMTSFIKQKFSKMPFKNKLIETDGYKLIAANNMNDMFWGVCFINGQWVGENQLGKIIMTYRDSLIPKKEVAETEKGKFAYRVQYSASSSSTSTYTVNTDESSQTFPVEWSEILRAWSREEVGRNIQEAISDRDIHEAE